MKIVDNAITDFAALRRHADTAVFGDYVNPADGVVYPHICTDVPESVARQVTRLAAAYMGRSPEQSLIFMRASPAGVAAPHQAHADDVMGAVSLMLYLNRAAHCQGGTAMVAHKATGMARAADVWGQAEVWRADANTPDAWTVTEMAAMQPNRALLFDADRMHRAEPVAGFGRSARDARLVLTGFFS